MIQKVKCYNIHRQQKQVSIPASRSRDESVGAEKEDLVSYPAKEEDQIYGCSVTASEDRDHGKINRF